MSILLNPATGKYLLNPAPEHLHEDVIQWLSEIEFFKTELSFLGKLLDKAFLRITSDQQLKELKALEEQLKSFQSGAIVDLYTKLVQHEHELSQLDSDIFKVRKKAIEEEHERQYLQLHNFYDKAKQLKKEIFKLVEKQLKLVKEVTKDFEEGSIAL